MSDAPPSETPDVAAPVPATSPVGLPTVGIAPVVVRAPRPPSTIRSHTLLVDAPPRRLRRVEDLLDLALSTIGSLSMLILAVYAHQTTTGVTQDVQNILAVVLRQVLVFPLQAIEGLATFIIPVAVLLGRILRRSWRSSVQAALGAVGGWLFGVTAYIALRTWAPTSLLAGLTVTGAGSAQLGISATYAALAGLLTGAGERRSVPAVRYGWASMWVIVGLAVLRSALPLSGAILSVLLGRAVGLVMRYILGVEDHRAHGIPLVRALRRAGLDAVCVVRMDRAPRARAWTVTTDAPLGYTEQVRENPLAAPVTGDAQADDAEPPALSDPAHDPEANTITQADDVDLAKVLSQAHSTALAEGRASVHRLYAVWDAGGVRRDVTVLDADRQVAGFLSTLWDRIRVKGLSPTRDMSVRPAAEHAALMTLEASRAGVRTPRLLGMAEAAESMLLVTEHVVGARSFDSLGADVPESVLDDLWEQIRCAHAAGLAHRAIDGGSVVVDAGGRVWLLDWDAGETISNELSRRVDLAQTLALVASGTGAERAIASASRTLSASQLASIAPMLQRVVLPSSTREAMGRRGRLLQELRDALVALTPTAHAPPRPDPPPPPPAGLAGDGLPGDLHCKSRRHGGPVDAVGADELRADQHRRRPGEYLVDPGRARLLTGHLSGRGPGPGGPVPDETEHMDLHRGSSGQFGRLPRGARGGGRCRHQSAFPQPQRRSDAGGRGHRRPGADHPIRRHRRPPHCSGGDDRPVHRIVPALGLGHGGGRRSCGRCDGGPGHSEGALLPVGEGGAHLPAGVAAADVDPVQPGPTGAGRRRHGPAESELRPLLRGEPVGLRLHPALLGAGHHLPGLQHGRLGGARARRHRTRRDRFDGGPGDRRRARRRGPVRRDRVPFGHLLDPDPRGVAQPAATPEDGKPVKGLRRPAPSIASADRRKDSAFQGASSAIPPIGSADRPTGVSADRLGRPADAHGLRCACT